VKRDYNKVCWSNEVTFYIREDNTMVYVTHGLGEEFLDKNLKPSFKSSYILVSVWSYYYGNKMGFLVIIEKGRRITTKRYLKTLKKYFILFYC